MRILIAPDKFKGSLSAKEVCEAVEIGLKKFNTNIEVISHPLADGGEGSLDILNYYFPLKRVEVEVQDPLFKTITASYLMSNDTAYIEMSSASGLQLLDINDQNCFHTSTIGTGQLILDAIHKKVKNIILFIGGSATNDAGIGMATALGYKFFDSNGIQLKGIGREIINIARIDASDLKVAVKNINFSVVCDVKNPLFGPEGAAFTYGSQKGASAEEIKLLDLGLRNFSKKVLDQMNKDVSTIEGGGAAGGLGAGAVVFLNASMQSGIDFMLEQTNFKKHFNVKIDLIITGEGSVDSQTLQGKVVKGVSDVSEKYNVPFYIVAGVVKEKDIINDALKPLGIKSIMELGVPVNDAIKNASVHLNRIAYHIAQNLN